MKLALAAALFAVILRVPFLGMGFGWDSDAWRMAAAAQQIAASGQYVASRAPGYPLTELMDAALARLGPVGTSPWVTNGLRALWAGLAAAAFALLARRVRAPSPLFLACAFTSVPAVFIAGTSTLDAMGSLAFGTTALLLAHSRRAVLAGVAVGIAAGMRPTGILFALPVIAMLRGRGALIALSFSVFVGALGYAPALFAAGARTIGYYDLGYPALSLVVKKATLDLWGPVGLFGFALATLWTLVAGRRRDTRVRAPAAAEHRALVALSLGLVVFVALYLRLPYKALYLAPAVPFALLLFARWARPAALHVALACLVASPWIGSLYEPGKFDDPVPSALGASIALDGRAFRVEARGAAWMDRLRREYGLAHGQAVVAAAGALPGASLVVAGDLLPMIRVLTGRVGGAVDVGEIRFVHHLSQDELRLAREEGRELYVAPGGTGSPTVRFGEDLAAAGVRPLPLPDRPVREGKRP